MQLPLSYALFSIPHHGSDRNWNEKFILHDIRIMDDYVVGCVIKEKYSIRPKAGLI